MGSTSFLGFSCPYLLLVFLNLLFVIFRNLYNIFLASVGTFSYFSVPYFGLACDHGNLFLCLEK